jgi:hypothetical protein
LIKKPSGVAYISKGHEPCADVCRPLRKLNDPVLPWQASPYYAWLPTSNVCWLAVLIFLHTWFMVVSVFAASSPQ